MRFAALGIVLFVLFSCGTSKGKEKTPAHEFSSADYPYIELFHSGIRFKMKGQYPQAIETFEKCKLMKPQDDAVYYALAQVYLITQQFNKSAENIQQAVKLRPENKWYVQEYAFMLFETKNFKEASKQFKRLVEVEPNNIEWLYSYAESLMRSGEVSASIKVLDKLEEEVGATPELSVQKFQMYRSVKQDEKALLELEKALKKYPSDVQLLANLVDFYFEKHQDEKAFAYLIQLAENDPQNGNAHLALAQYYDQKGNRAKTYDELKKAYQCDDVKLDTKVKILLSMFDSQPKLDPELFELAGILVNKYPNDARVYTVRGDCYMKAGMEKEALQDFVQALEYDKTKYAIWEQVLIMEYKNQDFESLFKHASSCVEYFPSQAKVFLFYGLSANETKHYQEAIEKLEIGIELVVNDNAMKAEMSAQLGEAYFSLKKAKEGKAAYENALNLDKENTLFKNNYAYRLALSGTDLDKAESIIKQVLAVSPNESHFLDTYGWVLFQKGKYADALEQFKKANVSRADDKLITEHLGDAYFKTGNVTEALNYWKKAKSLGSANLKLNEKIDKKTYVDPVF